MLRRKLESGKKYDKLIPSVSCVATDLGEGDTFHTVEEMRDWITKYSWQTSKLSPLLNAGNLQQLAENIYRFLYISYVIQIYIKSSISQQFNFILIE